MKLGTHRGAWLEGEWAGYSQCMVNEVSKRDTEIIALKKRIEELEEALIALERYGKRSQKKQENLDLTEIAECLYSISNPDSEAFEKFNPLIQQFEETAYQKGFNDRQSEIDKLKAFKDYVHKRLDDAGIPVDPESEHKEKGCRIGGRLDIALKEIKNQEYPKE